MCIVAVSFVILLYIQNLALTRFLNDAEDTLEAKHLEIVNANAEISDMDDVLEEYSLRLWQYQGRYRGAQESIEALEWRIAGLEGTIDSLHNPPRSYWDAQHVRLDDGRWLRYGQRYIHILDDDLYEFDNFTIVFDPELDERQTYIWLFTTAPSISPNGNLMVYVVGSGEDWGGTVNIYNMRTGESRWIDGLDDGQFGPGDAAWLDDRTLLVMIRHIHSRPQRGGTLWAYDTYNHTLTSMDITILNEHEFHRGIWALQVYGGVVYIEILEDADGQAMVYRRFTYSISVADAWRLIAAGDVRDTQ